MNGLIRRAGVAFSLLGTLIGPAAGDPIEDIIDQVTLTEYQSYLRVLTGVDPVPGEPPIYLPTRYMYTPQSQVAGQPSPCPGPIQCP